jgi:transcription initiation factor TFIIIB Brf1 subunit/transcription initiation factor TFIIB
MRLFLRKNDSVLKRNRKKTDRMACCLLPGVRSTAMTEMTEEPDVDWATLFGEEGGKEHGRPTEGYVCSECSTNTFIEIDNEEVICKKCGTHIEWLIDTTAEFRHFGSEDRAPDPSRIGNPMDELYPESSLGYRVMGRAGESKEMRKIRQYHQWNIMPYKERSLHVTCENLHVICNRAGIPTAIVNEAKHLYSQVGPLEIQRGDRKNGLQAACVYEGLKRHGTPWLPIEVAKIFKMDVKTVTRGIKQFSSLLDEHRHATGPTHFAMADTKKEYPPTHFRHCLEPAIHKLETPRSTYNELLEVATSIGNSIDKYGICSETTPSSLAAAALSIACQHLELPKTNEEVSRVCSISSATLQKCLKRLEKWRGQLIKEINCSE